MTSKTFRKIDKFHPKRDKLPIVSGVVAIFFLAAIGVHLLFGSHAAVPATPTLSDVCGVTSAYDINAYTGPTLPSPDSAVKFLLGASGSFYILPANGSSPTEVYVLGGSGGNTISIYNLSTGAQIGSSFTVGSSGYNIEWRFALDPQGNVWVVDTSNGDQLLKYSPSGTQTGSYTMPGELYSGVYGYTDSSGNWYAGDSYYRSIMPSGSAPVYDQTGKSHVFNESGVQVADNNMLVDGNVNQDPTTHDILSMSQQMLRVYTNTGTLKFQMGSDLKGNDSGPWHFNSASAAFENPNGGYYISDGDILSFDSNGGYLGSTTNYNGGGIPNTVGYNAGDALIYNGNLYVQTGGIDPQNGSNNGIYQRPGLYTLPTSTLTNYVNYPQGATGHLGIGAGMSTAAANNYFAAGTAPTVNMTFYPWWSSQASNFTIKYTVTNMQQVETNQLGPVQSFTLGNKISPGATAPVNVQIVNATTGNTTTGTYQISAKIYNNANPTVAVGADCLSYTVGAPGDDYNPTNWNGYGGSSQQVEQAHELGQNYVRLNTANFIDSCLPNATPTSITSSTNLQCPASQTTDLANAQALANKYGMTMGVEIAQTGDGFLDNEIVANGQWGRLVGQLAAQNPTVRDWLLWNEINNNGGNYGDGTWVAANIFEPAYNAIKAVNSSNFIIGGSTLEPSTGFWQAVGAAGGFKYIDDIDVHPYVGGNTSFEASAPQFVVPPYDATPTNAANSGQLDQLKQIACDTKDYAFNAGVSCLPISNSEMGFWNGANNTLAFQSQANKIIRASILQNSDGINNIAPFIGTNGTQGLNWVTIGNGYDGGDAPAVQAQVTMQRMLDGPTVSANRTFHQWLNTSVPHAYAADYAPASGATDQGHVVVVWADDYTVGIVPTLSQGGTINVTSEYGASSTVASGGSLSIDGDPQYLYVPAGQTLSITPVESYGPNLALVSAGASATASSYNSCILPTFNNSDTSYANSLISGTETNSVPGGGHCGSVAVAWSQDVSDTNPNFTVTLSKPTTLDRIFLSTNDLDNVNSGLRDATVQVASTNGGSFTTVGQVTNAFFQRNHLLSFASQTVAQIRVTNMDENFTGIGNGLPPIFWPFLCGSNQNTDNDVCYGALMVFGIEAYAPGSGVTVTPPPTPPAGLKTSSTPTYNSVSLTWSPSTDPGGPGLAGYYLYRTSNGVTTKLGPITGTSYTDNSVNADTNYTYTIAAFDSATPPNMSAQAPNPPLPVTTPSAPNQPPPAPTSVTATATATPANTDQVTVTWSEGPDTGGPGIAGYYVMRSTNGGAYTTLPPGSVATATTYTDSSVAANTNYTYEIMAFDSATPQDNSAVSAPSNQVTTPKIDTNPPSAPTGVTATAVSSSQINLSWTASSDPAGIADYQVYSLLGGVSTAVGPPVTTTSEGITGLAPYTYHNYYVIATDNNGLNSAKSTPANATTQVNPNVTTVYGRVTDSSTSAFLGGVTVVTGDYATPSGPTSATTNPEGWYLVTNIIPNIGHWYYYKYTGYTTNTTVIKYGTGEYKQDVALVKN